MPADDAIVQYVVPKSYAGLRADVFLRERLKKISRTRVRSIIESGTCWFKSGRQLSPSSRVDEGEIICMRRVEREEPQVPGTYGVIHEDDRILVVDKPAGLPVHPTSRYLKGNLLTLVRKRHSGRVLNLCHRIDRETSGIVLISKDLEGERLIKKQFSSRKVRKSYLALVLGHPEPASGTVEAALRRLPGAGIHTKMEVAGAYEVLDPGKPAVTRYRVLEVSRRFALVACFPETGRQHQIRIHMAHLGHPIVGDKLYSVSEKVFHRFTREGFSEGVAAELVLPRQALHAHTLSFLHPESAERVVFTAELAADIRQVFEQDK